MSSVAPIHRFVNAVLCAGLPSSGLRYSLKATLVDMCGGEPERA